MTPYTSPFDSLPRECWIDIDTQQLAENVRLLRKEMQDCPVLVAIKANGYGHGYDHAARAFVAGGATYLGVANLAEALIIKSLGLNAKILILGASLPHDIKTAAAAGLEFVVFTPEHLQILRELPRTATPTRVHLKVDTGMGRIGCLPQDAVALAQELLTIPGVQFAGLATHFAKSNGPDRSFAEHQIAVFHSVVTALAERNIRPEILHAAKSSGGLYYPQARYDMVRLGGVAYGLHPSKGMPIPPGVKPAFTWRARVVASKILPKGSPISYGGEYILPQDGRVGVVPVGYADGFRRLPKNCNKVLIDGRACNVLGRITMDQIMVDLGDMPDMTGAEAVLLGSQGVNAITVDDLADRWGTNTYDVYTGVALRVPRRVKA